MTANNPLTLIRTKVDSLLILTDDAIDNFVSYDETNRTKMVLEFTNRLKEIRNLIDALDDLSEETQLALNIHNQDLPSDIIEGLFRLLERSAKFRFLNLENSVDKDGGIH